MADPKKFLAYLKSQTSLKNNDKEKNEFGTNVPYKEKSFLDVTESEQQDINNIPEGISKNSKLTFGGMPFNRKELNEQLLSGRPQSLINSIKSSVNPVTNVAEQKSVISGSGESKDNTVSSGSKKSPPPVKQDDMLSEMDRIRKQQMAVDLSDVGFNLANMVGEAMRGPSEGFKAPAMGQYTLLPNQRDVLINQGMADIAGQEAATLRFMQENGMIPVAAGLQANSLAAKQKLLVNAGQIQSEIDAKNAEMINKARTTQQMAEAEIDAKNIMKQAQENAVSGQVIGQSWNNMMAGLSDINRNDLENEKIKALMNPKNSSSLYVSNLMQQSFPWMYSRNNRRQPQLGQGYSY